MLIKIIYISKIHLNQSRNYFSIRKKKAGIKKLKNSFIEYSQTIDYVYENLDHYNPTKK